MILVFIGIILSVIFSNSIINLYNQKTYAHPFSKNQAASFMARIFQMQIESELALTNLANDNVTFAQNHANKAALLLTPSMVIEIIEGNAQTARDLAAALNNLTMVSSSSESQKQIVRNLVSDINVSLNEVVSSRISQALTNNPSSSLEKNTEVGGGPIGSPDQGGDHYQADKNMSLDPLVFTELIDRVLVNYGNAYGVEFDMTNMSNMVMPVMPVSTATYVNNSSHGDMKMDSMMMSPSTKTNYPNQLNRNYSLVNITDYQSAQALATKALEIFNSKLKHIALDNNNKSNQSVFIANLEGGVSQLNNSIRNKASPLDIMMIVHTQIHPNLLEIFDLGIRKI